MLTLLVILAILALVGAGAYGVRVGIGAMPEPVYLGSDGFGVGG
jgi:hypothetical protein